MKQSRPSLIKRTWERVRVLSGAVFLTLAFFLVLPVIQAINKPLDADTLLLPVDAGAVPPPPPPPPEEEEPEPEEEPEEPPPDMSEDMAPLDLSQLELALGPSVSESWLGADFAINLSSMAGKDDDVGGLFSLDELDQAPRATHRQSPVMSKKVRQKAPGRVVLLFIVNEQGRVERPIVERSDDPVFEAPAVAAVKKWRYEPGKRNGKPVGTRVRQSIAFPGG